MWPWGYEIRALKRRQGLLFFITLEGVNKAFEWPSSIHPSEFNLCVEHIGPSSSCIGRDTLVQPSVHAQLVTLGFLRYCHPRAGLAWPWQFVTACQSHDPVTPSLCFWNMNMQSKNDWADYQKKHIVIVFKHQDISSVPQWKFSENRRNHHPMLAVVWSFLGIFPCHSWKGNRESASRHSAGPTWMHSQQLNH